MKKLGLLFFSILILSGSYAQIVSDFNKRQNKRENGKQFTERMNFGDAIYDSDASHYRNIGWFVNPGLTYMLGNSADDENRNYNLTPSGLPGYYLEAGMAHLFKKKPHGKPRKGLHYFDWGLGVKHFGGQEAYQPEGGDKTRGQFNMGNAFARAGIHNAWQLSLWNWIDQSLGFNFDYRIYGGKEDADYSPPNATVNQGKMVGQIQYTLGWGLKVQDGIFIIPSVQVPIFTVLQFDDFNPSHHWFNSRYQPFIFSVKFGWLFRKKGCPAVDDPDGKGKQQSDQYQMGQ